MSLSRIGGRLDGLARVGLLKLYIRLKFVQKFHKYLDTQILFFPEFPSGFNYVARKFVAASGVRFKPFSRIHLEELSESFVYRLILKLFGVSSEKNRTIIYAFEDNTRNMVDVEHYVNNCEGAAAESKNFVYLNSRCMDISKQVVAKCMQEVFGYSTFVDPLTCTSEMVKKSDTNGIHDGEVVQGPLTADQIEDDYVYQLIVDNRVGGDMVQDLRLVVIGNQIPALYRKQRPLHDRFSNTNTIVHLEEPLDYFSQDELDNLVKFVAEFELDICEMDVLRDAKNKQIYVVDVNRTVSGPPNHLSLAKSMAVVGKLSEAFEQEFLKR